MDPRPAQNLSLKLVQEPPLRLLEFRIHRAQFPVVQPLTPQLQFLEPTTLQMIRQFKTVIVSMLKMVLDQIFLAPTLICIVVRILEMASRWACAVQSSARKKMN